MLMHCLLIKPGKHLPHAARGIIPTGVLHVLQWGYRQKQAKEEHQHVAGCMAHTLSRWAHLESV